MSKAKTYISKQFLELYTEVEVEENGEKVKKRISFTGGMRKPQRVNGKFTTADEKLQKAIESSPGYGKKFILMKGKGKGMIANAEKQAPKKDEGNEPIVAEEVKTISDAKNFLTDKDNDLGVKVSEVPNKEAILQKAKELNVEFPNLK